MLHYRQHCAVARALELVGERWTLLVVRELMLGASTVTDLRRALPHMSKTTLTTRLNGLVKAGIVATDDTAYHLTNEGARLAPVLRELAAWAIDAGAANLTEEHLDLDYLLWDIQRRLDRTRLPWRRTVLEVELTNRQPADRYFWLVLSRTELAVQRQAPDGPVDSRLVVPTEDLVRWWVGELDWNGLVRRPDVRVSGQLRREGPRWLLRSAFTPDAIDAAQLSGRPR